MPKLKELILGFSIWRVLVFLAAIPAIFVLPIRSGFTFLSQNDPIGNLLTMWSNFDGVYFLTLAQYGLGVTGVSNFMYAFFPIYPWLIAQFNIVIQNYLVSALVVSSVSSVFAFYFLYLLLRKDFSKSTTRMIIFLILIFPTSFFFGSVYSESLFLLLSVLTFYFARKGNFFIAGLFAAVASATRVTGIFLWPALAIEYYQAHGSSFKKIFHLDLLSLLAPPVGLLLWMRTQYLMTGNPFLFITSQAQIGSNRITTKLVLLHQIFYRYFKMLVTMEKFDPLFFTVLLEFVCGAVVIALLIYGFKKIRPSYWIYCLLSYLLPTLTGTFSSLPRYTLLLFPVFILTALLLEKSHPFLRILYYFLSFVGSFLAISLFTRGYFVG